MNRVATVFIMLSLCIINFYIAKGVVLHSQPKFLQYKVNSFSCILQGGMTAYKSKLETPYKGRLFSIASGNAIVSLFGDVKKMSLDKFSAAVATYDTIGFAALLLIMLMWFKSSLFCIVAFAACSAYRWVPAAEGLIYPWDSPMPAIWGGILVLSQSRFKRWLPIAAGLAMGFKETIILAALIPLFDLTVSKRERINRFLIIGTVCVAVKVLIDIAVGNPIPLLTMWVHYPEQSCRTGEYWLIHKNINLLLSMRLDQVIFAAGGMVVSAFIFKTTKMTRGIILAYLPFMFTFCIISEYRLWNEMLPVILFGMDWSKVK
jgi:hypothetical protein